MHSGDLVPHLLRSATAHVSYKYEAAGFAIALHATVLQNLIVAQLVKKAPTFKEPASSVHSSQEPATVHYSEPGKCNP
jgi:hypothetical protein